MIGSRTRSGLVALSGLVIVAVCAVAQRSVEPGLGSPPGRDGDAVAAVRELLVRQGVPGQDRWRNTVTPDGRGGWTVAMWTAPRLGPNRPMGSPDLVYDVFDSRYDPGHGLDVRLVPEGEMIVQIVDPGGSLDPDAIDLSSPPATGS